MGDVVLRVEGLGKRFRIGAREPQRHWRRLLRSLRTPGGAAASEPAADPWFWALRDVSFDVRRGEVVGVVGRNGAGKTTLLKILSRITVPTEGRVTIAGRVASLLEVGTGFHPELTGRENVFLNGAILGMSRRETERNFDDIVAFSGVGDFLDVPVKRYSSGMRVRLAFSVAAHLEPEVLVIDEVLAVGDAAFQQRCLGKMQDAAGAGRTVLFVSHNMSAVRALCDRCVLLEAGRVAHVGATDAVVERYLAAAGEATQVALAERGDRNGSGALRFERVHVDGGGQDAQPASGRALRVAVRLAPVGDLPRKDVRVVAIVHDAYGQRLCAFDTRLTNANLEHCDAPVDLECRVTRLPLAAGRYDLTLWCGVGDDTADYVEHAARFDVLEGDFFGSGRTTLPHKHGPLLVPHAWSAASEGAWEDAE